MTSRERIRRTLRREPVDRVPISTYDLNPWNPDTLECQWPSYRRLMEKIRSDTDGLYMWGWNPWRVSERWTFRSETAHDGTVTTYGCLNTPKGELTCTQRRSPDVNTTWTTEHLLKTPEDIDRYLSVVRELFTFDEANLAAAKESFAIAEERIGDDGVVMADSGDPSAYVPPLFEFGNFTTLCYTHKDAILALIDAHMVPVLERFRLDAEHGFGDINRICGPEYYGAPYLPLEFFREMVLPGCAEAMRLLDEGGIFPRLHCHGRVRDLLPIMVEMGAKGTDPVEPPPDGDIELAEVKQLYGDDLVIFGNTELKALETSTPAEVRKLVKRQMDDAKEGGGFIMLPTAIPINNPLSPQTEANFFAWIDAGLEFGSYG